MAKIAVAASKNGSKTGVLSQENEQTKIAAQAYQFFVDRGCQDGFDAEDWLRAEAVIKGKKK